MTSMAIRRKKGFEMDTLECLSCRQTQSNQNFLHTILIDYKKGGVFHGSSL
jgi:hypothetical protein